MGTDTGQHRSTSVTDVWVQPDIGTDTGQHRYTSVNDVEAILKGRGDKERDDEDDQRGREAANIGPHRLPMLGGAAHRYRHRYQPKRHR